MNSGEALVRDTIDDLVHGTFDFGHKRRDCCYM
jgi:hypothetical protein